MIHYEGIPPHMTMQWTIEEISAYDNMIHYKEIPPHDNKVHHDRIPQHIARYTLFVTIREQQQNYFFVKKIKFCEK